MMAYRSSRHESTGYASQFIVLGQELSLLLNCMPTNQLKNEHAGIHEFVYKQQQVIQRAFKLVQRNLSENQNH